MDVQDSIQRRRSYSFFDFTLDLDAECLRVGTNEVRLRPKSFQVMRYLTEHHGRLVTRQELLQKVWGDVTVTDDSLTKCIADIRKALGNEYQKLVRTVPRRGFLFEAEVRFTETPHDDRLHLAKAQQNQVQQGAHVPNSKPRVPFWTVRKAAIVAVAVFGFVVTFIWLAWRRQVFDRAPTFHAIAVLPFEDLSGGTDRQYLADGITETLITRLGHTSPLRVIARTSVNQYRGTRKPIREIARALNVDLLLEGTITQSLGRVRVTVNLIQASPEKHIWARAYEANSRDLLGLQNELVGVIAADIQPKLRPRQESKVARSRPVNPEAQLAYWRARYFLNALRDPEAISKSIEYAEQAVRVEPNYAQAHAVLAISYGMLSGGSTIPPAAALRARWAARRAVALDEELADARVALGSVSLLYDWDWAGAEREIKRALALNPSDAEGHQWLANYLAAVGRVDEAVHESKRARELDPLSFRTNWNIGRILCFARKYDEALTALRHAGEMQRNSSMVDVWLVKVCLKKGLADEAVAIDIRLRGYRDGLSAELLGVLRTAYAEKGLRGYWIKLRELLASRFAATANGVYRLAEINANLGDNEQAFRWLEKAYESRTNWMPWIKVDPSLDPLRSDPRFEAIVKKMSLPL